MIEIRSRGALRGEEVAIFDFLALNMTQQQWAEWLKAPLELAAAHGHVSLSQKLVGAKAEVGTALHAAIRGRHEEVMVNLLENAAVDVGAKDENHRTPLHVALRTTPLHLVQSRDYSPHAELAFQRSSAWCERVVRLLLCKGADPNIIDSSGTPLHYACRYQHLGAARALLGAGADLNIRANVGDGFGDSGSALDAAAGSSPADIVRLLIEHGADVTAADPDGFTPLHQAGFSRYAEVVDVLIEAGASVEARDANDETPLHAAAGVLNPTVVRALLKYGANVDDRCQFARTPLHRATQRAVSENFRRLDAADVVGLLLRSDADETLVDDGGQTAEDVANEELMQSDYREDVIQRMRELLANAPADKAWRRRGYWALCRAHPDRLQENLLRPDNARTDGSKRRSPHSSSRPSRVGAEIGLQRIDGSWADAAMWMLGLGEDAIFRTIVGYL